MMNTRYLILLGFALVAVLILMVAGLAHGEAVIEDLDFPLEGEITIEYDTAAQVLAGDLWVYYPIETLKVGLGWGFLRESALASFTDDYQLFVELELDDGMNIFVRGHRFDGFKPIVGARLEF